MGIIKLLTDLGSSNIIMLKHVCNFLHRVASHSSTNRMDYASLAEIFGPLITPFEGESKIPPDALALVTLLIENPDWVPKKQHPPVIKSLSSDLLDSNLTGLSSVIPYLYLTEEIMCEHPSVTLVCHKALPFEGHLYISNYRLLYHYSSKIEGTLFELPLNTIHSIRRQKKDSEDFVIEGKNLTTYHFQFPSPEDCQRVMDKITEIIPTSINQLFTFTYRLFFESKVQVRSSLNNPASEYERQGVKIGEHWRMYSHKESVSYPRQVLIPTSLEDLSDFSKTYSEHRFPTLVYKDSKTGACILLSSKQISNTPSSSPIVSSSIGRNSLGDSIGFVDEEPDLITLIKDMQPKGILEIITCLRPTDLCKANFSQKNRKMLTFTDVSSIYPTLQDCLLFNDMERAKPAIKEWTLSLSEVILSTSSTVVNFQRGKSILLEDDGTDHFGTIGRILIIIDPYYRTIEGFQTLIEHVWIRFGYKFSDASNNASKRAPFIHFIDSVYQIFLQFPSCFEFNEAFLIELLNSTFSGCYGTFISNTEREAFQMLPISVSVWSYLSAENARFINPLYCCKDKTPLIPDTSTKKIVFWSGYFSQSNTQFGVARIKLKLGDDNDKRSLDVSKSLLGTLDSSLILKYTNSSTIELNVSQNLLSSIPTCLIYAPSINILNLSSNRITCISKDFIDLLKTFKGLESIDLRGNPIVLIDSSIGELSKLTSLKLSGCGDKIDIEPIFKLTNLTQLYLENFGIEELSESIRDMKKLTILSLSENKLSKLSLTLPKLKSLILSNNQFSDAKNCIDLVCKKLRSIDLSFNQLENIPENILTYNRISKLKLHNNKLIRLPPQIVKLSKLTFLDISNNNIKVIAPNLCSIKKLETVRHNGNPIIFPPNHVVGKGTDVLLKYLEDRISRSTPLRRVRLLLVGQENVGKSSISYYLKNNNANQVNISTDGIHIDDWEVKISTGNVTQPVDIKIWDFAGQDVYYSTHQLFLGGQSIYMVVWNIMSDERDTRIRFWLESIKARTNGIADVILVATHMDHELCTPEYVRDSLSTIEKKYCSRFPFIKNIIAVSCSTGEGFPQLRSIIKNVVSELKYIGNFIPSKYLFLEDELNYQGKELCPPMISFDDFKDYASLFDLQNEQALEAAELLHQWGSIIHHNDPQLKNMVILNPSWLVDVMATILTTKHRYIKQGVLKHSDLIHIWHESEYPRKFHPALLQLLQKFEVTYNLSDDKKNQIQWEDGISLVPSVLPEMEPEDVKQLFPEFETTEQYAREYKFNFIPAGFINHLILRIMYQTKQDCIFWRYGIAGYIEEDPSSKVLLELLPQQSLLKLIVRGSGPVKYFLRCVDIIEAFIESWFHLDVTVQVPCTHCFRDKIQPLHRFPYEKCKDAAVHGESYLPCPSGSSVRLDVIVPDLSMAEVPKIEYTEIEIEKEIGKGGFATVYKARYNGKLVALKQIDLGEESKLEDAYSDFMRESWIMSGVQHPNIIGFLGLCSNPLCIVTDFASKGNLFDFIHSNNPDIQNEVKQLSLQFKIAYDIACGMGFLHNRIPAIIHADLKSPNILLLSSNPKDPVVAVVADFGLSRTWVPVLQGRQVDNPVWLAPEILCGKGYSESADVYAYGVILYEIFTQKEFFGEFTFMSAMEDALIAGKRPEIPNTLHDDFVNIIERCWNQEPEKRPSFEEILSIWKNIIPKHINEDELNLSVDESVHKEELYDNQCLLQTLSPWTVIKNAVSVNNEEDIWCSEKGYISIWNIYDNYLPEKQIPLTNSIIDMKYCCPKNSNDGIVWTIDSKNNVRVFNSRNTKLLYKKSFVYQVLKNICHVNEDIWISTESGFIQCFKAYSMKRSNLIDYQIHHKFEDKNLEEVAKLLQSSENGIIRSNSSFSDDSITIYNCFTGEQLIEWFKNTYPENQPVSIDKLLSSSIVVPALWKKKRKKNINPILHEASLYVLQSDFQTGIVPELEKQAIIGFSVEVEHFTGACISCMKYDNELECVWLGTDIGIVVFDITRCSIAFSIQIGAIHCLELVDNTLWVTIKNESKIQIYNKYSLLLVREIDAHTGPITTLTYVDGCIWSGSSDASIKIWSSVHFSLLEELSDYHDTSVLQLIPSVTKPIPHVVSMGADGSAAVWTYIKDTNWNYSTNDIEKVIALKIIISIIFTNFFHF